ncbi:Actin-binding protein F [Phytophthora citrophthora]|uniref:Actin-binding protein F n=1 Tax=Phytophthora citrophthora TaxID=4793 RepID=A0AAD9LJ12_9STRA|nr:Actin-binding protein F [Phytophthora citrophthora]
MVIAAFEAQLASEGATGTTEAQLAFQEAFALAENVSAKLQLVQKTFVPGTPDFWFYSALCTLLELQILVEEGKHELAWQKLEGSKQELEMVERELTGRTCWRRTQRIQRRRLLLKLDLLYKLKRPDEEIKNVTQEITTALLLSYQDPEPEGVMTEIRKETFPTILNEELLDLDAIIQIKLGALDYSTAKDASLKAILNNLDIFGREKVFEKVLAWNGAEEEHWKMLDVFLDDIPFEFTDIPGYADVIIQDVQRRKNKDPFKDYSFNFRAVHRNMPFPQLLECARKKPELFRCNSEFAVRGIQLLRAAAEVDIGQDSVLLSDTQNQKELQHLATFLEFLRDFTPSAVGSLQVMISYRKLQLLNVICWTNSNAVTELQNCLVEYVKVAGGRTLNAFDYIGSCGFDSVSQADHNEIICKSLTTLWSLAADGRAVFTTLCSYLDNGFLDAQHALTMIKLGKGEFSEWAEKLKVNDQELTNDSCSAQLVFCETNPAFFMPDDPLRIHVRTRNIKSLTAHLYQIKVTEYYSRLRREIKGDICLDGLLPTEEQVVDLSHLTQWQESRVPIEFRATKNSPRGVFVVEVFEKGITCRAILRKGFLRHVERVTAQGHEFTVLDERGNLLLDAHAMLLNVKSGSSRAQHGREYTPDSNGKILIPFRHPKEGISSDKFAIAFCKGSFGTFHGSFSYLAESFDVDVDMHIDCEQLLPGSVAQLVTRPRLLVAGIATGEPLALVVAVKIVIEFNLANTSNVGSSSHKVVLSFASMQQIVDEPPCFEIPMDSEGFTIMLEGRVSRPHGNQDYTVKLTDLPKVHSSKRFEVQRVNNFDVTSTVHFVRKPLEPGNPYSPSQFSILVVGHNGEPVPNIQADFAFKHAHAKDLIKVKLQSDSKGEVNLGQLQDIERLDVELGARTGTPRSCSWELPNLRSYRPQIVNCSVDETVEIPIPFAFSAKVEAWIDAKMISVCEVVDAVLQNAAHFSSITVIKNDLNRSVGIAVRISRPGKFVVYVRTLNLKFPVTLCDQKHIEASFPNGLIIQPTQVLLATSTLPLTISSQKLKIDDENKLVLEIQLRNASRRSTHVLVWLKSFLDMCSKTVSEVLVADGLAPVTSSGSRLPKLNFHSSPLENDFLKMRKVSDEYAYILQRRALVSSNEGSLLLLGSPLLPRPSLLQNPIVIGESDMEVVTVEAGDKVTGFKSVASRDIQSVGHSTRGSMMMKRSCPRSSTGYRTLQPSISFLGKQSQLLASSVVSLDGVVRFELSGLPFFSSEIGSFEVCAIVFDTDGGSVCSQQLAMTLPGRNNTLILPKRDIRLSVEEALTPSNHCHQVDSHECIRVGDVKTLPRSFSSKYALYDSLTSAINLWPTITPGSEVSELASKLNEWWTLSQHEKNTFYYTNACDDFHFYLFRKDPDFFQQFAKPLVEAKVCKSLVDHYVLGDEASLRQLFLGPASFQRLSCVEKLLIAERMTDVELKTQICRAVIREIDSNYPIGCTALPVLFNTILSQGQVEPSAAPPPPVEQASGAMFGAPMAAQANYPARRMQQMQQVAYAPASPAYSPESASFPLGGVNYAFGSSPAVNISSSQVIEETESLEIAEYLMDDDDFGVRSLDSGSDEEEDDDDDDQDLEVENKKKRKKVKQEMPYIPPGKVRRVQEKRFYSGQYPLLSGHNKFWKEYAEFVLRSQTEGEQFISSYFPEALSSITEGLFALAVLGLDTEAKPTQVQLSSAVDKRVTLSSSCNTVLYRRTIGPAECNSTANSILILKQRNEDEYGDTNTELLVNKIYTSVVTLSNIGSENLTNVNLLLQIPQGAIPMGSSGFYTKNEIGNVAPNYTSEFRFSFYFPEVGTFEQYPARASLDGMIIGWAQMQDDTPSCKVVRTATGVNLTSWTDVSARGSLQEVVQFMDSVLPGVTIDYQKLFWRCHDKPFFLGLINYLRSKMVFQCGVWKYGLLHRDEQTMREYFSGMSELSQSVGSGFVSSFVDESRLYHVERYASALERFDHCEFGPFLTRRVHPVTGRVDSQASLLFSAKTMGKRILNAEARQFFGELCQRLGTHTRMNGQHLLVMAYYMVLFDRIEDAIKIVTRLDNLTGAESSKLKATVQYAYLAAFLDFFRSHDHQGRVFPVARRAVASYVTHPQPRWRKRFEKMQEFLEEYDAFEVQSLGQLQDMEMVDTSAESDQPNRDNMSSSKGSQVKLEASVGEGAVVLSSQAIGLCELAFYPIDVELMFSTEPFNTFSDSAASASSLLLVEPRQQVSVSLNTPAADSGLAETMVQIPEELRASQMMVRVREDTSSRTVKSAAPPITIVLPFFNSSLHVEILTQCGILQVLRGGLPVRSCYVKVYAKVSTGSSRTKTEFYKDGYTDLLGKFDYVGINGDLISSVEKFSILISHDKFGASVEQADPPVLATTVGDFGEKEEREMLLF